MGGVLMCSCVRVFMCSCGAPVLEFACRWFGLRAGRQALPGHWLNTRQAGLPKGRVGASINRVFMWTTNWQPANR